MFRAMFSPIIRSTWLYLQYLVVFIQVAGGWCHGWVGTAFQHIQDTNQQHFGWILPDTVNTVKCSWWTETILKIYKTLVLPTFLYGSENLTLTALQRRRIEAAEMKLLRPLAGYTLHDHKTKESVRRELQTEYILDKTDEYRRNWLLHLQRMPLNRIPLKS